MGSTDSVPAAFELTLVDGHELLRLRGRPPATPHGAADAAGGAVASQAAQASPGRDPAAGLATDTGWAGIEALALEIAQPNAAAPDSDGAVGNGSMSRFQNRRLALREATLVTDLSRLERALSGCPLDDAGIKEARLWMGPDGPRLMGRFAAADREAPFTIRIELHSSADGERRLRVTFEDVRIFAPLPLPAPLIGSAIARAIGAGAAATNGAVRSVGPAIDMDPLELALVSALVAHGWRMPDIKRGWLEAVERTGDQLRLRFGGQGETHDGHAAAAPRHSTAASTPAATSAAFWKEGQLPSETLAPAEKLFFGGDLRGAEAIYRQALAANPDDRAALARLLALGVAAGGADVPELAAAMILRWPSFMQGLLLAAIAAQEGRDDRRAAALFGRAAELAEEHGEDEDARLSRAAEAAAAARALAAESARAAAEATTASDEEPPSDQPELRTDQPIEPSERAERLAQGREEARAAESSDTLAATPLAANLREAAADTFRAGALAGERAAEQDADSRERGMPAREQEVLSRLAHEHGEHAREREAVPAPAPSQNQQPASTSGPEPLHRSVPEAVAARGSAGTPEGAGALVLLAEQAFQAREWDRARRLYALLDRAPEATKLIPRQALVQRRAVLARGAGDVAEAESHFRELAALDPQHIEARQALAQIAFDRQDLAAAAAHLEDLLQLLPLDAREALLGVRQRLAETYFDLSNWDAARYYGESVLAQDPGRIPMLERLAEVYRRLELYDAAVDAFERLARLYVRPRSRAEALYQQGEVLRDRLRDEARAFDSYLKSSDLDPTFGPTAARLIAGYWNQGQFDDAVDVGDELRRAGHLPELEVPVRVRLAVATALVAGDAHRGGAAADLDYAPFDATTAAVTLAEAAAHLSARPPSDLEPAVLLLESWGAHELRERGGDPIVDRLRNILADGVAEDPAAVGAARALGWLADRKGNTATARGYFSIVAFVDEQDGCVARLDELGPAPAPTSAAYALAVPSEPSPTTDTPDAVDAGAEGGDVRITADHVADRFAVFACRSPLAALRALYRADSVSAPGAAEVSERERRVGFLRTARVRALSRFVVSNEYARALTDSAHA